MSIGSGMEEGINLHIGKYIFERKLIQVGDDSAFWFMKQVLCENAHSHLPTIYHDKDIQKLIFCIVLRVDQYLLSYFLNKILNLNALLLRFLFLLKLNVLFDLIFIF